MQDLETLEIDYDHNLGRLDDEKDELEWFIFEEPDIHCANMKYKDYEKLKKFVDEFDYMNKWSKLNLEYASTSVRISIDNIKKYASICKRLDKKINTLKKNKLSYKPKGTVVTKQEIKMRNTTNGHYKFWNIKQLDTLIITEWGAIGTVGESLIKQFDTVEDATIYFQKKEKEKFNKGYQRA